MIERIRVSVKGLSKNTLSKEKAGSYLETEKR